MNNYLLETNANDSYDKNEYFMGGDIIASNKNGCRPRLFLKYIRCNLGSNRV